MSLFETIRAFLLGVISAVVFACGGENFDKIRNIDSAGETIICFGDSLTEGVGGAEGEDYPTVLSRLLALPVVNAGRRGNTTAQALQRLANAVLDKNPRLVIILLGGNDFLRQLPRPDDFSSFVNGAKTRFKSYKNSMYEFEKGYLIHLVKVCGGKASEAARLP